VLTAGTPQHAASGCVMQSQPGYANACQHNISAPAQPESCCNTRCLHHGKHSSRNHHHYTQQVQLTQCVLAGSLLMPNTHQRGSRQHSCLSRPLCCMAPERACKSCHPQVVCYCTLLCQLHRAQLPHKQGSWRLTQFCASTPRNCCTLLCVSDKAGHASSFQVLPCCPIACTQLEPSSALAPPS
jgi:hypothetical protein